MKVKKLILTNYKCFESLSIDFDQNLTVFSGDNGTGKSSILESIAIMLSWYVNRMVFSTSTNARPITASSIKNGTPVAKIEIKCEHPDHYDFTWSLLKRNFRFPQKNINIYDKSNMTQLNDFLDYLRNQIIANEEITNIPLIAYYPVNRNVLDIPIRIRSKHKFSLLSTYDEALTTGANFRTFFEWFREREDLENESYRHLGKLELFEDSQLRAVRNALSEFMSDFESPTIRRNPLRFEITKKGEKLTVDQLSDGEKCLMALIGDLARRLAIANPALENSLCGNGIVLIDEIDLHFHPKWQRMIIPKLRSVFPNIQFIISTHSPHVITHVKKENLFILSEKHGIYTAEPPSESYGKSADAILEDIMGLDTTRPIIILERLHLLSKLIDENKLAKAKYELEELRNEIGNDSALTRAAVLIKLKESAVK